jgi:hypothetical protein
MPVPLPWDGSGYFYAGETEDYLFCVDSSSADTTGEWGDAPEGVLAYPYFGGINGSFPTCQTVGPAGFIDHITGCGAGFGPTCDHENDGNANLCPNFTPYDADECYNDFDAGLLFPPTHTILDGNITPCVPGQIGAVGIICNNVIWGVGTAVATLDIDVYNNKSYDVYVNILMDWDQSGGWGGVSTFPGAMAPEHVVVNLPVPPGYIGPLSALGPPNFLVGPDPSYVWARFSITETPIAQPWDGSGTFDDGETEDYLMFVCPDCDGNGTLDIRDAIWEVNCVLGIGPCPCDVNRDGVDNVLDVLVIVNLILANICP